MSNRVVFRNAARLAQGSSVTVARLVALGIGHRDPRRPSAKRYPVFLRVVASFKYFVYVSSAFLELGHHICELLKRYLTISVSINLSNDLVNCLLTQTLAESEDFLDLVS